MYRLATKGITATILATAVCGFFSSASLACCWCDDSEEEGPPESRSLLQNQDPRVPTQPIMYQQSLLPADSDKQASERRDAVIDIPVVDASKCTGSQREALPLYKAGKIKQPVWDALGQEGPLADKLRIHIMSVKDENAVFENIIKRSDTIYKLEMKVGVDKAIELIYLDK